jgi:hypothetical protein
MTRSATALGLFFTVLALTACGPSEEQRRAAAEAAERAREAKLAPTLAVYREARARQDWPLALASAEVLLADGPGSAAAAEAAEGLDALREAAATQLEERRLRALWGYTSTPVDGQTRPQKAASMRNRRPDADDAASFTVPPTVQLVLRNDPRWGQSVYLVIEEGLFDCGRPCAFRIAFDGAEPKRFAGEASSTGTRPALFIKDDAGFIRALEGARQVTVQAADGRGPILEFDTGGYDPVRYRTGG